MFETAGATSQEGATPGVAPGAAPGVPPAATLAEVREQAASLGAVVARLEPGAVPLGEAPALWQAFDSIERLASGAKVLLAARVDESGVARRAGDRNTAEFLARTSGSSVGAARSVLDTSRKLDGLAHTQAALRRGELSRAQAEHVATAAAVNPRAEQSLLRTAERASLARLREESARRRAEADPDPEARQRRIHNARRLRRWTDADGTWNLAASGTPDAGSRINAALDPLIDQYFHTARRGGRREDREAYAFDALVHLARTATGTAVSTRPTHADRAATSDTASDSPEAGPEAGPATDHTGAAGPGTADRSALPATAADPLDATAAEGHPAAGQSTLPGITAADTPGTGSPGPATGQTGPPVPARTNPTHLALLRVDVEALQRGRVDDGELCEIAGVGPIAVSAARELLPESVLELVITRGVDVANVTHLGRGPTAAQKIALLWTSPGCTIDTCPRRHHRGIQHDHRTPWPDCHETRLDNLDRDCPWHHHLKTHHDWALTPGTGPRPMVPPHHPDHPTNQQPPDHHQPGDHPGDPPGDPPP